MDDLTIEILTDDADYDLQRFDCGEEALNLFLTTHLVRQHRNKILRAYILVATLQKPSGAGILHIMRQLF